MDHFAEAPTHTQKCTRNLEINSHHIKQQLPGLSTLASDKPSAVQAIHSPLPPRISRLGRREHLTSGGKEMLPILLTSTSSHGGPMQGPSPIYMEVQYRVHLCSDGGPVQGPSPVHMEVQCRAHLQFTWRPSTGSISSSHGDPVQGPSPVHMEIQCKAISSSHEGPVQGPSPVNMEVQCKAHLQLTWRSSARPSPVNMEVQCKAISS